MKRLPVHIVPIVWDEIARQVRYIALDSIDNALAWEDRVTATLRGLEDFHGHAVDQDASEQLGYTVRKLVFERTYLIHYRVDERAEQIRVVGFRHGARLPRDGEP